MFEHIVIRRTEEEHTFSPGQIAEALFYYQKVQLILDSRALFSFVKAYGLNTLKRFLERPEVSAVYTEELLGTLTNTFASTQYHKFIALSLEGHQDKIFKNSEERLINELTRMGIPAKEARRFAAFFLDRVPLRKLSGNHYIKGGIPESGMQDLTDTKYLSQAIRVVISNLVGGYDPGTDLEIEMFESNEGCCFFTNINFDRINEQRKLSVQELEPVTFAFLLTKILDARADSIMASYYGGDFVTSPTASEMIQLRHAQMLQRTNINLNERKQFEDIALPDFPCLSEVIDSGERSLDDYFHLLDKSTRFKDWLKGVSPDEALVRTYMQDMSSKGWIETLPAKAVRYLITLGLDKLAPTAGAIAGVVDTFLVEKLCAGWRPNHFVTKRLAPFVSGR